MSFIDCENASKERPAYDARWYKMIQVTDFLKLIVCYLNNFRCQEVNIQISVARCSRKLLTICSIWFIYQALISVSGVKKC